MATQRPRSTRGAFLTLVCVILCAGAGFEWWRSQSNFTTLRWRGFAAMTAEGKLCLLYSNAPTTPSDRAGVHSVPYARTGKNAAIIQWPLFGYSWPTNPTTGESKLTAVAPLWFVGGLLALHPLWWLTRGRHQASLADEMG